MISHIEKVESLVIQRFLEIVGSAQFLSRTAKLPHSVKLKIHRWRQRTGSSPVTGTTSEQALYCLLRLFLQKSERAHAAAPPFQIEPAALDYDLVS